MGIGFSIALGIGFSVILLDWFKIRQISLGVIAFFFFFFANLVLTAEILGFIKKVSDPIWFLLIQTFLLLLLSIIWYCLRKPRISFKAFPEKIKSQFTQKLSLDARNWFFIIAVTVFYAILFYLIIIIPPNNNDSMHTHLSRVGHWLQNNSFAPWTTMRIRSIIYPFNAQIPVYWLILLTRSDRMIEIVQYLGAFLSFAGIYSLSRTIGFDRNPSLFAGLVWLTFPLVIFQSTTTHTDLITAGFALCSVAFLLSGIQKKDTSLLILAGALIGFSLGFKQYVLYLFPGLGIGILIFLLLKKFSIRKLLVFLLSMLVSFILCGSFIYFQNLHFYGNPLGPKSFLETETASFANGRIQSNLKINFGRIFYQYLSCDGLTRTPREACIAQKAHFFEFLDQKLGIDLDSSFGIKDAEEGDSFVYRQDYGFNEDSSWFGPIGALLLLPCSIWGLVVLARKKNWFALTVCLAALSFASASILLRMGWDPYQGRYLITSIGLLVPFIGLIYTKSLTSRLFTILITCCCLFVLMFTVLTNPLKPLVSQKTFEEAYAWSSSHPSLSILTKTLYKIHGEIAVEKDIRYYDEVGIATLTDSTYAAVLRAVNENVPDTATLGIVTVLNYEIWDYPFWGKDFGRKIVLITNSEDLANWDWLSKHNINFILHSHLRQPISSEISPQCSVIYRDDFWRLYQCSPHPNGQNP